MSNLTTSQKTALEQLQSCKSAAETLKSVIDNNKIINEYNFSQDEAWGAADNAWKNRRDEAQRNYENDVKIRTQQEEQRLKEEVKYTDCSRPWFYGCGSSAVQGFCEKTFGSDWTFRGCHDCSEKSAFRDWRYISCRRTSAGVNTALNAWKNANIRPFTFTEPRPEKNAGIFVHKPLQILPPVAINCCSNYMNITANEVTDNIQSCTQTIEQEIQKLTTSLPEKSGVLLPASDNGVGAPSPKLVTEVTVKSDDTKDKNNMLVIIAIALLLFTFFILSISSIAAST
jgi:hypothetical protein